MSIKIQCGNGHRLVARDEIAGKRIKCPQCGDIVTVPVPAVEEVIDLSLDDLIPDPPATGTATETQRSPSAPPSQPAPAADDPFAGLPSMENPVVDGPLESPSTDSPFESLPEFSTDTPFPPAPQPSAIPLAPIHTQPAPRHRASLSADAPSPVTTANPGNDVSDSERLHPALIAAGVASSMSLILGLVVLSMLLIGRGGRSTQVAQTISAESASVPADVAAPREPETQTPALRQQEQPTASVAEVQPQTEETGEPEHHSEPVRSGTLDLPKLGINKSAMAIVAFDQRSGDLALVDDSKQLSIYRAGFFDGDEKMIQRLESKFDEGAEYLVFKPWKDRTLLLTSDGKKVWLYDAETGELFNEPDQIANPISVSRPGLYSSENAHDKRFYTAASEILLSAYTEERPITHSSQGVIIGVSPSGRMIFGQYPTFSYPATFGDSNGWLGHVRSVGHLPMDPTDRHWKLNDKFVRWDGTTAVNAGSDRNRQVNGDLLAYIPDSPWTLFSTKEGLSLVHPESLETRDVMSMPNQVLDSKLRLTQLNTRGFVDRNNNRLLLVTREILSSIPLDKLGIPEGPLLGVQVDLPPVVQPGVQVEATVHAAPGVEVTLQAAPEGVTLSDDQLSWTPSQDQIGPQDLVFRCQAGADTADQKVGVFVSQLGVDVPFVVSRSFLSEDGVQALAVSGIRPDDKHRFAVIDTQSLKYKISPESFAGTVRHCCFDRSEIYLLMSTYELYVFDATTLRQKSRYYYGLHNLQLRSQSSSPPIYDNLRLLDDKLVVQNASRLTYFNRSNLSPADAIDPIDDPKHPARTITNDGFVRVGPALFDANNQFDHFLQLPNLIDLEGNRIPDTPPQLDSSVPSHTLFGGTRIDLQETGNGLSLGKGSPTLIYGRKEQKPVLSVAGDCVSITLGGALFLVHPYEAGLLRRPTAPNELPAEEKPLRIVGKNLPMLASGQRKTKFEFEISGGTPPYRITSEIKNAYGQQAFQLDERTGAGILDGTALTQAITKNASDSARRIERMLSIPEVHGRDLADAIKSYREFASKTCSRYSTVAFKEFPVSVSLNIGVRDSKGTSRGLQHVFALEIPVRGMLAQIKDPSRFQVRSEPEDQAPQTSQPPASNAPARLVADFQTLENLQISKSTGDLRRDYFEHLRRFQLDDGLGELSLKHRALVHSLPRTGRSLYQRSPITLELANGESVTGLLSSVTRDRIAIKTTDNPSRNYFPYEFSADSLVRLHQINEQALSSDDRRREQAAMVEKMKEYSSKNGFLLPNAIDSPDGTPLLSWRVLLLPYFGYTELFSLFRLDQPWDSPHNRQLIPFMPREYITHMDVAARGHTSIEILSGEQTLFPPKRVIRRSSIASNQFRSHVIGVIKRPELASEWTKPSDIQLTEDKLPYEMIEPEEEGSSNRVSLFTFDLGPRPMGKIPGQQTDTRRSPTRDTQPHPIFITDANR